MYGIYCQWGPEQTQTDRQPNSEIDVIEKVKYLIYSRSWLIRDVFFESKQFQLTVELSGLSCT